jgi:hypothetical protein
MIFLTTGLHRIMLDSNRFPHVQPDERLLRDEERLLDGGHRSLQQLLLMRGSAGHSQHTL